MLENLRRKSLIKTYKDSIHQVHIEKGHVIHLDSFSIAQHKQRLSKETEEKSFSSTFDGVSKEFRLIYNTLIKVPFNMICCSSGTFTMGHNDQANNQPRQGVIERPFLLGETQITQELYQAVMGTNPSEFKNDSQNPVEKVSWYDAILFCNKLSELQGLECCYVLTDISTIDKDGVDQKRIMSAKVTCYFNKNGYRLPLEKEWEYAAKAGTQNQWAGTNKAKELGEYAWFSYNSSGSTHPVKTKKPNEWGIYDMSGNVWEWCWDKYDPEPNDYRICRGGCSGMEFPLYLSSAFRGYDSPGHYALSHGFRVCRSIVN